MKSNIICFDIIVFLICFLFGAANLFADVHDVFNSGGFETWSEEKK